MTKYSLFPLGGMDTESRQDQLVKSPMNQHKRTMVRDAVNVDLDDGRIRLRPALTQVLDKDIRYLWARPHGAIYGVLDGMWVKLTPPDWGLTPLADLGHGPVAYTELNDLVVASGDTGLWRYDGHTARRLTLPRPPAPMLRPAPGSLPEGRYHVAITWLNAAGEESARSPAAPCDATGLAITLPLPLTTEVARVRIYMSGWNDGALRLVEEAPADTTTINVMSVLARSLDAPPAHLEPMPGGRYLAQWGGRLVTASGRTLRFSQPLDYGRHDPRHDFVQLETAPITFVVPLEGGIWVGTARSATFLAGASPGELRVVKTAACRPVPGSATLLPAELSGDASSGGRRCALWLADNGYVLGTADGQLVEVHAQVLKGLLANEGTTVVAGTRVLTITR